jgi:hypothetical protein
LKLSENKFIDIASHYYYDISIALSVNGVYYVWGNCREEIETEPKKIFESIIDIFAHYFQLTFQTLNI